ncbi:MAG: ParB N-terminal domain-containing protein [Flavobacteriaceae bacterium]|nr:ParB N-terminal domain-containing protein [Flavobacteriaceae bacterium]
MVEEYQIINVPIPDLIPDETNPNIMTKEEENSLERVITKYGFLAPIIVDKGLNIVDGEHRYKVYKKLGRETIPAFVIDVDKMDKKMLRQLMNKLRGVHDRHKDALEFKEMLDGGRLDGLAEMLARPVSEFTSLLAPPDELNQDPNPTKGYEESFLSGNIKQITIYMMNDKYEETLPILERLMTEYGVDNHSDIFFKLLEEHETKE